MRINLKRWPSFSLIVTIFVAGFIFVNQVKGQEQAEESQIATQRTSDGTRIVISTSGPAEFRSYWLENPYRLVVEFKSRNIVSNIDNEVVVNQGGIKKITSSYFRRGRKRSLKSLTFELAQKVPYKIWQEGNTILLDLQTPLETVVFPVGEKEIFAGSETSNGIIKRLKAMDTALTQVTETESRLPLETPEAEVTRKVEEGIDEAEKEGIDEVETKIILSKSGTLLQKIPGAEVTEKAEEGADETLKAMLPKAKALPAAESPEVRKSMMGMVFWLVSLALIPGLGFLVWHKRRDEKLKKFKSELQEKNKLLTQKESIRKAAEKTSLQEEKGYEQLKNSLESLKSELQEKNKRIEQEEVLRKAIEEASLQKEKEFEQFKNSFESLKDELVKKGLMEKELSPEEKERPWIPEKSQERRISPRLSLTKDFNKTIILRIESSNLPQSMKCFAKNISSGGLCFETTEEFEEKEPINLRLFFYGDQVPMIKIQAHIIWKKTVEPMNNYGVSFDLLEEKDKLELDRYVESELREPQLAERSES